MYVCIYVCICRCKNCKKLNPTLEKLSKEFSAGKDIPYNVWMRKLASI